MRRDRSEAATDVVALAAQASELDVNASHFRSPNSSLWIIGAHVFGLPAEVIACRSFPVLAYVRRRNDELELVCLVVEAPLAADSKRRFWSQLLYHVAAGAENGISLTHKVIRARVGKRRDMNAQQIGRDRQLLAPPLQVEDSWVLCCAASCPHG